MSLIAQDPTSNLAVRPEDYPMPRFLLFRATQPVPGVTHTGFAKCAHCERISYVEASTVDPSPDCPVKHFEGNTAAVEGPRKPEKPPPAQASPQRQLVLESLPFNDPLPPLQPRTAFDSVSPDPMPPPLVLDARPPDAVRKRQVRRDAAT